LFVWPKRAVGDAANVEFFLANEKEFALDLYRTVRPRPALCGTNNDLIAFHSPTAATEASLSTSNMPGPM